jgi:hypothetical protein
VQCIARIQDVSKEAIRQMQALRTESAPTVISEGLKNILRTVD